jgi:hypothetical protein
MFENKAAKAHAQRDAELGQFLATLTDEEGGISEDNEARFMTYFTEHYANKRGRDAAQRNTDADDQKPSPSLGPSTAGSRRATRP